MTIPLQTFLKCWCELASAATCCRLFTAAFFPPWFTKASWQKVSTQNWAQRVIDFANSRRLGGPRALPLRRTETIAQPNPVTCELLPCDPPPGIMAMRTTIESANARDRCHSLGGTSRSMQRSTSVASKSNPDFASAPARSSEAQK